MFARSLSQREKQIFVFCLFVICIYLGYQFVFIPARQEEAMWQARIISARRQIRQDHQTLEQESEIQVLYDRYMESLKQAGPDTQEMTSLLSEIESVAQKLDLKIEDMKPRRIRSQDQYNHFPVNIRIKGTMETVTRFLYALQSVPHLFRIDELRLEKFSIRQNEVQCELIASRMLIKED